LEVLKRKVSFSEEKEQKTFDSMAVESAPLPGNKSLFASFSSEKEES